MIDGVLFCLGFGNDMVGQEGKKTLREGDLEKMTIFGQFFFCDNCVALKTNPGQTLPGHEHSGSCLFLLIGQKRGQVFVRLLQQGKIIFDITNSPEGVFGELNCYFCLHSAIGSHLF